MPWSAMTCKMALCKKSGGSLGGAQHGAPQQVAPVHGGAGQRPRARWVVLRVEALEAVGDAQDLRVCTSRVQVVYILLFFNEPLL